MDAVAIMQSKSDCLRVAATDKQAARDTKTPKNPFKNHDNITASQAGSLSNAERELGDGETRCRCDFTEGPRDRAGRSARSGQPGSRLSSLPRHAARRAALPRIRHRSAGISGAYADHP